MPNLSLERAHLEQAERQSIEAEMRISRQRALIERLRAAHRDTTLAEAMLRQFEHTRDVLDKQRRLALDEIERAERAR